VLPNQRLSACVLGIGLRRTSRQKVPPDNGGREKRGSMAGFQQLDGISRIRYGPTGATLKTRSFVDLGRAFPFYDHLNVRRRPAQTPGGDFGRGGTRPQQPFDPSTHCVRSGPSALRLRRIAHGPERG
jgi:hypothetical protein